jgi:hypothetical protein
VEIFLLTPALYLLQKLVIGTGVREQPLGGGGADVAWPMSTDNIQQHALTWIAHRWESL